MKRKHYVKLNRQEWRLALNGLNRFRNKLIAAGRYTDDVDELMLRLVNAKPQKHRMWGGMEGITETLKTAQMEWVKQMNSI